MRPRKPPRLPSRITEAAPGAWWITGQAEGPWLRGPRKRHAFGEVGSLRTDQLGRNSCATWLRGHPLRDRWGQKRDRSRSTKLREPTTTATPKRRPFACNSAGRRQHVAALAQATCPSARPARLGTQAPASNTLLPGQPPLRARIRSGPDSQRAPAPRRSPKAKAADRPGTRSHKLPFSRVAGSDPSPRNLCPGTAGVRWAADRRRWLIEQQQAAAGSRNLLMHHLSGPPPPWPWRRGRLPKGRCDHEVGR